MSEMVERVARALYEASPFRSASGSYDEQTDTYRAFCRLLARAAIHAMRNPGQGAFVRAQHAMQTDDLQPTLGEIEAGWWAVIDAALVDTKTEEG